MPRTLEPLLLFGYLACADSFIDQFTFLPLRVFFAAAQRLDRKTRALTPAQSRDVLRVLLISLATANVGSEPQTPPNLVGPHPTPDHLVAAVRRRGAAGPAATYSRSHLQSQPPLAEVSSRSSTKYCSRGRSLLPWQLRPRLARQAREPVN